MITIFNNNDNINIINENSTSLRSMIQRIMLIDEGVSLFYW